jgi:hypothetical protein
MSVWRTNPENINGLEMLHLAEAYKRRMRFEARLTAVATAELYAEARNPKKHMSASEFIATAGYRG